MASREVLSACSSRRLILVGFFFCSWEFDRWVVLRMRSERLCRSVAGGGGALDFSGVRRACLWVFCEMGFGCGRFSASFWALHG